MKFIAILLAILLSGCEQEQTNEIYTCVGGNVASVLMLTWKFDYPEYVGLPVLFRVYYKDTHISVVPITYVIANTPSFGRIETANTYLSFIPMNYGITECKTLYFRITAQVNNWQTSKLSNEVFKFVR